MLTAAGLVAALPVAVLAGTAPPPPECAVIDSIGRCLVAAVDPGRPGGPTGPPQDEADGPADRPVRAGSDGSGAPPPPEYLVRPFGEGGWVRTGVPDQLLAAAAPDGPPAAGQAVPAEVLAQRAIDELAIAPPTLHTSTTTSGFVGVPLWLWIDGDAAATGPISATATAGTAEVTATGRLTAVDWAMGPPGELVRCSGPGTPWNGQDGPSPDCGYVYALRSLPVRTGGSGAWTITATGVWTVTWSGVTGGLPVDGTQTVRVSSEVALPVGEVQVLADGDGG